MAEKIKQPTDVVIKGNKDIEMVLKFEKRMADNFNRAAEVTEREMIDSVYDTIDQYVPLRTGNLIKSKKEINVDNSPAIQWDAGYGVYVYNRKITNTTLKGKRGPFWYERYIADYKDYVVNKAVDTYMKGLK